MFFIKHIILFLCSVKIYFFIYSCTLYFWLVFGLSLSHVHFTCTLLRLSLHVFHMYIKAYMICIVCPLHVHWLTYDSQYMSFACTLLMLSLHLFNMYTKDNMMFTTCFLSSTLSCSFVQTIYTSSYIACTLILVW